MSTRNTSRRRVSRFVAAAAVAGLALTATTPARADYTIDLRAVQVNGQPLGGGNTGKNLLVAPGDVVGLQLWGQVQGLDAVKDEQTKTASGNIVSSNGGLKGNLSATPAPGVDVDADGVPDVRIFNATGSQNGAVQDLDGDGDLDVGTPIATQNVTDFFHARANTPVNTNVDLGGGKSEVLMGIATFTVSPVGSGDTFLNFVTRLEPNGSPSNESALWGEDGHYPYNATLRPYGAGTPVHVAVPEPTGVLMAAMVGSLCALARRRRDASQR